MLREIVAFFRGVPPTRSAVLAITVLALAACGVKGPLRLPTPAGTAAATSDASDASAKTESSPASTPASPPREPAERKP